MTLPNYFTSKLATKVFEPPTEIVPRCNAAIYGGNCFYFYKIDIGFFVRIRQKSEGRRQKAKGKKEGCKLEGYDNCLGGHDMTNNK
ncbi:MAG: hypothetical protein F6K41_42705 [Symploca sp. SIO3E6]|nr:hypothetical protein [Caldora sp. SIO3E6]